MTLVDQAVPDIVSQEEAKTFRVRGFVKLPGLLSEAAIEMLRRAMAQALASFAASPNSYDVTAAAEGIWGGGQLETGGSVQHDLASLGEAIRRSALPRLVDDAGGTHPRGRFLVDTSVWRRVPELAAFALDGCLGQVASELLGVAEVRYFDDQLFVKETGARDRAAFHQDLSYFHLDGSRGCVFWIPLDPVRRGSGAIGYVPGSHRWELVANPNVFMSRMAFPGSSSVDLPDIDSDPEAFGVVYPDADPGDVLVHHFLTIHGSEGNLGLTGRRAFSLRYCDAEIRYRERPGAPAQPLHSKGMADGAALDDDIHPPVWPRRRWHEGR